MENKILKYLLDINEAIKRIEIYFLNCEEFKEYELNPMLQDATVYVMVKKYVPILKLEIQILMQNIGNI